MIKILLNAGEAGGNGSPEKAPELKAEPPVTTRIVKAGKTERELLLEHQNRRLLKVARKTSDDKVAVEKQVAELTREKQKLNEEAQATKQKFSWMGYSN